MSLDIQSMKKKLLQKVKDSSYDSIFGEHAAIKDRSGAL
jgi:hypothetical protein